jgi:hypothetical protein
MAPLPKSVALSVLVAGLVFVGSAAAHTLEVTRASNANKSLAKALCASTNDPDESCVSSTPGPCNRVSDHRVRCTINLTLEAKDKSQGRCVVVVEWSIRGKSPKLRLQVLGFRSCKQVKPPEPVPTP